MTPAPGIVQTVSIGIFARNEEAVITRILGSIFDQSLLKGLQARNLRCEVVCLINGSQDRTAELARAVFQQQRRANPQRLYFQAKVVELGIPGKLNAWNEFVHSLSAKEAEFLLLMDSDIEFQGTNCLWNLIHALRSDERAHVSTDLPVKKFPTQPLGFFRSHLSRGASTTTHSAAAQLCAQLYCIRSTIARRIYLPKDLPACEDGFIKALVCTDFLDHEIWPERICQAPDARHAFEAYTSISTLARNQKRQVMGQTIVHILIDRYLPTLSAQQRLSLAKTLRHKDVNEPNWLKDLLSAHLKQRRFWHLYPYQVGLRIKRLPLLRPWQRLTCFPSAMASLGLELVGGYLGWSALRHGSTSYWPEVARQKSASLPSAPHLKATT